MTPTYVAAVPTKCWQYLFIWARGRTNAECMLATPLSLNPNLQLFSNLNCFLKLTCGTFLSMRRIGFPASLITLFLITIWTLNQHTVWHIFTMTIFLYEAAYIYILSAPDHNVSLKLWPVGYWYIEVGIFIPRNSFIGEDAINLLFKITELSKRSKWFSPDQFSLFL